MIKKELLPYVVVYKNVFDNIDEILNIIKMSEVSDDFNYFKGQFKFGKSGPDHENGVKWPVYVDRMSEKILDTPDKINENKAILEIIRCRDLTLQDYLNDYETDSIWPVAINKGDHDKDQGFALVKHNGQSTKPKFNNGYWLDFHLDKVQVKYEYGKQHVVTTMIYLNDDYEEGEIEFFIPGNKILSYKPQSGDLILFPSFYPYYHSIKIPFNADRYAIRTSYDLNFETSLMKNSLEVVDVLSKKEIEESLDKNNIVYVDGRLG